MDMGIAVFAILHSVLLMRSGVESVLLIPTDQEFMTEGTIARRTRWHNVCLWEKKSCWRAMRHAVSEKSYVSTTCICLLTLSSPRRKYQHFWARETQLEISYGCWDAEKAFTMLKMHENILLLIVYFNFSDFFVHP